MNSMMIKAGFVALGISVITILGGAQSTQTQDGKTVFLTYKCNSCHSIQALGIAKTSASTDGEAPPDLSGVGLKHTAAWMAKYLQKKEELNDKKHTKKFKGSETELNTLVAWLATQKKK